MTNIESIKDDVQRIGSELNQLLITAESASPTSEQFIGNWDKICSTVQRQIAEELLRLAVVGPIKSGKSTFVNSLLSGDYLKRGAGVITSIVTRIRKGKALKATLFFKSWDDVNADIEQAIALFPAVNWPKDIGPFDIRRQTDRQHLETALDEISHEILMEGGTLNAGAILLSNYLKGYDTVKNDVNSENRKVDYIGEGFDAHQTFVGNDALSVYLKDIQLEIDSEFLRPDIEIADCQGSDSPNPMHLAMIQDYLVQANMIIYVISSRTGLRQADIRFLSIIKKMGILDNILFVVNCDFSEHESLAELNTLVEKVKQELSIVKPDPMVFAFSSLFTLFREMENQLSQKDRNRLARWSDMTEMVENAVVERDRFINMLVSLTDPKRGFLLFQNHLERLRVVAEGLRHRVDLQRKILSGDQNHANRIIEKISRHDEKISHIKGLIKDTLDGGVQKLTIELKKDVDNFFSKKSDGILDDMLQFIRNFHVALKDYGDALEKSGFNNTLYLIFQDFKQKIDGFMAEHILPRITHYLKEKEDAIGAFLESMYTPYEAMVVDALADYNESVEKLGISPVFVDMTSARSIDMADVKQLFGIQMPTSEAGMRYSARIKTDAAIRFGFYSAIKLMKKIFKKPIADTREDAYSALKDGVYRMKREMENNILFHFKNYQENIKFQYILKLVVGASNFILEELESRFQAYLSDLTRLAALMNEKGTSNQDTIRALEKMDNMAGRIMMDIQSTGRQLKDVVEAVPA